MQIAKVRNFKLLFNLTGNHIMNTKNILAAAALSLIGALSANSVLASEVTNFNDTPSTASRASVKAELVRARIAGELNNTAQTYGSFDSKTFTSQLRRAGVRTEAVMAVHQHSFNELYVGA